MKVTQFILLIQLILTLTSRNGMAIERHACSMSGKVLISVNLPHAETEPCGSCCESEVKLVDSSCCTENYSFIQCEEEAESIRNLSSLITPTQVFTIIVTAFQINFPASKFQASELSYKEPPYISGRTVITQNCLLRI